MATEIKVPTLGESVTSATVARWIKHPGEAVLGRRAAGRAGDRQGDRRGQCPGCRRADRDQRARGHRGRGGRRARRGRSRRHPDGSRPRRHPDRRGVSAGACAGSGVASGCAAFVISNVGPSNAGPNDADPRISCPNRASPNSGTPGGCVGRGCPRPTPRRRQDDRGAAPGCRGDRHRKRQGRPHHQGRCVGVPQPPGRPAPRPSGPRRAARARRARGARAHDAPAPHHRRAG